MIKFIFCLALVLNAVSHGKDIKLAADPWCPFTCDPQSGKKGVMVEVAESIFTKLGYNVKYETLNWARSIRDAREGKFTAVVGALRGDAPDFIFPQDTFVSQETCYFTRSDSSSSINTTDDLSNKTLGVVQDYTYGEPLDTFIKSDKNKKINFVSGVDTTVKLIKMLAAHRIDVFAEDKSVANYNLTLLPALKGKIKTNSCLNPGPLYVAFSPANPQSKELAIAFDRELRRMERSKSLSAILKKYGL